MKARYHEKEKMSQRIESYFPGGSDCKDSACNVGDLDSIPVLGRSPKEGIATHSSILAWRIPTNRETWWATIYEVAKSWTRLSDQAQNSKREYSSWEYCPILSYCKTEE